MRKKLLSILLSVAVAIAMIPAAGTVAFAEESNYGLYVGGEAVTWLNDYMYGYDAETNTLNLFDKRYQYDIPEEGSDIQAVIQCDHDLTIILPSYDFFSSNAIAVKVDGTLTLEPSTEHSGSCGFNGGNGNSCIIADKIINNGAISVWPTDAADVTDYALIECQEFENNGSCHLETSYVNVDTGIYCDSFVNNGTLTADTEWGYIINQAVVANKVYPMSRTHAIFVHSILMQSMIYLTCFSTRKDRATLRSDSSSLVGLSERRLSSLLFLPLWKPKR